MSTKLHRTEGSGKEMQLEKWSQILSKIGPKLCEMTEAGRLPIKPSGAGAFKCGTLQTLHFLELDSRGGGQTF